MKTSVFRRCAVVSAAALIAAASVTGCQSKTEKAREEMVEQATDFRTQLNKMPADLDEVSKRLLAASSGQNPRRADDFREYGKALAQLRSDARVLAREANAAEVDAAKYFTTWAEKTRKTPTADRPAAREAAAVSKAKVDQALGYLTRGREDFLSLITALDNVEKKLGADLTEQGVMAVQSDVQTAITKTLDVRNYMDRLDEVIDAAVTSK